ncbi:MAG TPA: RNB domain-containing ribonuclease [Pyrinomonadaceae bacterium]|jgi:exoribonuclease-2|nr:RNB domain-containing ribonuclease [Pyrinomonadaceae bacterium]
MNDHVKTSQFEHQAENAMVENGFEPAFSQAVWDQVKEIDNTAPTVTAAVRDMRDLLWSSIDNTTSRDLDQIEWAEQLSNGDIRVLVGIADVDAKVGKDTPIDHHAAKNTVTVYTESKIFPMLPEQLSTELTSLNEGEDRQAVVADMTIKENGDVPESTFYRALVNNHAKLDYESIGPWLDGQAVPEKVARVSGLTEQIELQQKAALRLQKYRDIKGALQFESIESSAVVENGEVKQIRRVEPNGARKLIENFMVAANVEMAEFLENSGALSLRRVVRNPERWDGIVRIAAEFGEQLPAEPDQTALATFLNKRREADPEHFPDLSLSIVKLIGPGLYVVQRPGEDAGGHFGLAVNDYSHSTAPNRRFTDIVVQRLVKGVIDKTLSPYSAEELDAIAEHANLQEKAARKVERKMRKIVAATVMQRHIGESYDAIVTGDTSAGVFARILRPPVDGRVVRGEQGVDVGDKVRVRLLSANPHNGFIDFGVER